ncbi:hypothetical protein [Dyadobacter koreensis]|uniref:hypothetical protein n=1 Tax=Dyadobacter koreensis TaxID=408657 RepID=UPI000B819369|nr:hypothetical protein [Dyadobacter koreensis]
MRTSSLKLKIFNSKQKGVIVVRVLVRIRGRAAVIIGRNKVEKQPYAELLFEAGKLFEFTSA